MNRILSLNRRAYAQTGAYALRFFAIYAAFCHLPRFFCRLRRVFYRLRQKPCFSFFSMIVSKRAHRYILQNEKPTRRQDEKPARRYGTKTERRWCGIKRIAVQFQEDPSLEHIDVLVRASERDADVDALMERIALTLPDALTVQDAAGVVRKIPVGDILSVSVSGKYLQIVTEEGTFFARQSLQSLEQSLNPRLFVRVSRYEIVNLSRVVRYDFTLSGTLRLELAGGVETWASRRCIPLIRRRLGGKE